MQVAVGSPASVSIHLDSLQKWSPEACAVQDLLELGFWQALLRQVDRHAAGFWKEPSRLPWTDRMFPHWRRSLWRPLQVLLT